MSKIRLRLSVGAALLALVFTQASFSKEGRIGAHLEGLLNAARVGNPEFASMQFEASAAALQAEAARGKLAVTWSELVSRIKTTHAQLYYLEQNERLTREILDLMARLEKVAQVRYGSGLAAQQDVIRAQLEQTTMRNELIALDAERSQLQARLKALVGRPASETLATPESIRTLPAPETMRFDV